MSEYFFAILVTKNWTGRPGFDSQCCGMRHHSSVTEHSVFYFVVAKLQHKNYIYFKENLLQLFNMLGVKLYWYISLTEDQI